MSEYSEIITYLMHHIGNKQLLTILLKDIADFNQFQNKNTSHQIDIKPEEIGHKQEKRQHLPSLGWLSFKHNKPFTPKLDI